MGLSHFFGLSKPDIKIESPLIDPRVDQAVGRALAAHHEAREEIRKGNGEVIAMLNDALGIKEPPN